MQETVCPGRGIPPCSLALSEVLFTIKEFLFGSGTGCKDSLCSPLKQFCDLCYWAMNILSKRE